MADYKVTGGCLCGGIKYEITQKPSRAHYCHCGMCRKRLGADFLTAGDVPNEHFNLIKQDTLQEYHSSEMATSVFCRVCGGSVFAKAREGGPMDAIKNIFILLGSMDGDPAVEVGFHIFTKYKAPWVKINDGLPQSEEGELMKLEEMM